MSDPLSITASLVAVLQLAGTVVTYLNQVKEASSDRNRILLELSSTRGLLFSLKDLVERPSSDDAGDSALYLLGGPNGPLEQYRSALESLATKLAPAMGLRAVGKALDSSSSKIHDKSDGAGGKRQEATRSEREKVARLLLERGANKEARLSNGMTILYGAVCEGNEASVKLLLESGVDVDAKVDSGMTALSAAAALGNLSIVKFLIDAGADVSIRDSFGMTASQIAERYGHQAVAQAIPTLPETKESSLALR